MKPDNAETGMIQTQYEQYYEMLRLHLSFSWNIPALAVATMVAFIALDPEKSKEWMRSPVSFSILLFIAGLFVLVMLVHNYRNLIFAGIYAKAISHLEERYGVVMGVQHHQVKDKLKGLSSISSSTCLSLFLLVLTLGLFCGSIYFGFFAETCVNKRDLSPILLQGK